MSDIAYDERLLNSLLDAAPPLRMPSLSLVEAQSTLTRLQQPHAAPPVSVAPAHSEPMSSAPVSSAPVSSELASAELTITELTFTEPTSIKPAPTEGAPIEPLFSVAPASSEPLVSAPPVSIAPPANAPPSLPPIAFQAHPGAPIPSAPPVSIAPPRVGPPSIPSTVAEPPRLIIVSDPPTDSGMFRLADLDFDEAPAAGAATSEAITVNAPPPLPSDSISDVIAAVAAEVERLGTDDDIIDLDATSVELVFIED